MFHNDAYVPVLGKRHPEALGRSGSVIWSNLWELIGPLMCGVLNEGKTSFFERLNRQVEGSGIGMAIVKKIIDNNGGKLRLKVKREREVCLRLNLELKNTLSPLVGIKDCSG